MKNYVNKINEGFHRLGSEEIKPASVELKFKNKVRLGVMIRHDLKKIKFLRKMIIFIKKIVMEFYPGI